MGQLGVEVDFVLVDSPATEVSDPARSFPPSPIIGMTPAAIGSTLSVRAVKAQTRVEVKMAEDVLITAGPDTNLQIEPGAEGA